MTSTAELGRRRRARGRGAAGSTARTPAGEDHQPQVPEGVTGPPPKLRRRPLLVAGSVATIALGGAGAAWVYTSMSDDVAVIGVRESIGRGEVIDAQDLMVVQLSPDPGLRPVGAERAEEVIGTRAAVDLQAGGLVAEDALTVQVSPSEGMSMVGVALPPTLMPGEPLLIGDHVRIVSTPGQGVDPTAGDPGPPWSIEATVAGVTPPEAMVGGVSVVDVLVPHDQAADLAARAATGNVILVLDSRERD